MAETVGPVAARTISIFTGTTGTEVKINCLTEANISVTRGEIDTTCKDSDPTYRDFKPDRIEWEMSGTGNLAFDATNGANEMFDALVAGTPLTVHWMNDNAGDDVYRGSAYCMQWEASAPNEGVATFSFTFKGVGAISVATIS